MLELEDSLFNYISINKPMIPLTETQQQKKDKQKNCYHCHQPLLGPRYFIGENEDYNVDDHDVCIYFFL